MVTSFEIGKTGIMIEYLSLLLKNNYYSELKVSDEYTVELGKCIYKYLKDTFPKPTWENPDIEYKSIADYYFELCKVYNKSNDETDPSKIIYNINEPPSTPSSIDEINEYNIATWELNSYVMQFIYTNTVINENTSSLEEIALAQELLVYDGYVINNIGVIDKPFNELCYYIQQSLKSKSLYSTSNSAMPLTGYFDIFVETYLRNLQEGGVKLNGNNLL